MSGPAWEEAALAVTRGSEYMARVYLTAVIGLEDLPLLRRMLREGNARQHAVQDICTCFRAQPGHPHLLACLSTALEAGCAVGDEEPAVGFYVRHVVAEIFRRVRVTAAAEAIQAAWLHAYYSPGHPVCRKRLLRQHAELAGVMGGAGRQP